MLSAHPENLNVPMRQPHGRTRRSKALDALLLTLSASAAVALVWAAVQRTSAPPSLQWQKLQASAGYQVTGQVLRPAERTRKLAHGDVVRLSFTPVSGEVGGADAQRPFTVTLVPVAASNHEGLYFNRLRESVPALELLETEKFRLPLQRGPAKASAELGLMDGKPTAQACISRTGLVAGDAAALWADIGSWQPQGARARVMQLLGFADPIPWDCVLVSISLGDSAAAPIGPETKAALAQHWQVFWKSWEAAKPWVQISGT